MSTDIVARLRGELLNCQCSARSQSECCCDTVWPESQCYEAADEIERLRGEVEELRKYQRIAAELSDKFNGTPCAEIRWQQELDAALARAEAAERERDRWMAAAAQEREVSEAAEAKVAKLRAALLPFADIGEWSEDFFDASMASVDAALGDLRRARAVLQETETKGE